MKEELILLFSFLLIAGITAGCKGESRTEFDPGKVVQIDAGHVDIFVPVKATQSTTIDTQGWAADRKAGSPLTELIVVSDGKQTSLAPKMSISRPDVAKALSNPALEKVGWSLPIPAASLGSGKHKLEFYAVLSDKTFAALYCGPRKFCEVEVTP